MYAIIPAGGSGSRLWPLSRSNFPKHLLNLTGQGSMIQQTIKRIKSLIPPTQILVITEQSHARELKKQLPRIPSNNILIEPDRRDTAPVIGLGAFYAYSKDPETVVAALHADHIICKEKEFLKILKVAEKIAKKHDVIVTLGIQPTHASTGYGYIASGTEFMRQNNIEIFHVQGFTEKPNLPTAKAFLAAGNYFWNAGMFIAKASVLIDAYKKYAPKIYKGLQEISRSFGKKNERKKLGKLYPLLPKVPIDTAIMEKSNNIVVIPADIEWSDVGSWDTLQAILPPTSSTNLVVGEHLGLDTENSLIYSTGSRLIATIGMENIAVIDAGDAILICPLDRTQDIKKIVQKLKKDGPKKYV